MPAALTASRMPESVFWPGRIVTDFAGASAFAVKVAPSKLPNEKVSVPLPTASFVFAKPVDAILCAWASSDP